MKWAWFYDLVLREVHQPVDLSLKTFHPLSLEKIILMMKTFFDFIDFIDLIDHHHNCLLYPRAPLKPKFENVVVTATLDNLEISESYNFPKYPILKYSHMSDATGWLFKVFTQFTHILSKASVACEIKNIVFLVPRIL